MSKKNKVLKSGLGKVVRTSICLFVLVLAICFMFVPFFNNLKFGLDLQGGFEVLYQVESIDGSKMDSDKMNSTYKTLQKRINSLGVSEPEIIVEGDDKIRVKLAGVTDPAVARSQLATVATLSFRDTEDNLLMTSDVISGASVSTDASGRPAVLLEVVDQNKFYEVTDKISKSEENQMVIWIDFEEMTDSYLSEGMMCGSDETNCLSAATVSQAFASDVVIEGDFTVEEVENLVDLINSGSLPSKVVEISSRTVGASFGESTLDNTLLAGIIGISLIILLLLLVYRFTGVISAVSIILYTFLVFLVFWTVGGVLTLPGIAALVLGIGMAVDSNVITFARIKDELYKGKSLPAAFNSGSKESFSAIVDSNITTLIVAIIMFIFGESTVKGFATMLIITVAVTMFTMVLITRVLMKKFVNTGYFNDKIKLFINADMKKIGNVEKQVKVKNSVFANVDFFKHTTKLVSLSAIIIVVGVVMTFMNGLNLGIDYKAGSSIVIDTDKKLDEKMIESDLEKLDITSNEIIITDNEVSIRTTDSMNGDKVSEVTTYFESVHDAKIDIEVVSNMVSRDLTINAIISVLVAMIGIILYVSFRFKFNYAIAAVIALFHDVFIVFCLFAIFNIEISVMFIAAILAIIGYSINDTIVLFDRIRENLLKKKSNKIDNVMLKDICNQSIRDTFARTIYTSITTLIPVIALIFMVSNEILTFNLAMLFGLIVGTYSSIFIATNLFLKLEARSMKKGKKEKRIYTDYYHEK